MRMDSMGDKQEGTAMQPLLALSYELFELYD